MLIFIYLHTLYRNILELLNYIKKKKSLVVLLIYNLYINYIITCTQCVILSYGQNNEKLMASV